MSMIESQQYNVKYTVQEIFASKMSFVQKTKSFIGLFIPFVYGASFEFFISIVSAKGSNSFSQSI